MMWKLRPLTRLAYTTVFLTLCTIVTILPNFFHLYQTFFRLSLRGPMVMMSSFLLGPFIGAFIGSLSDLIAAQFSFALWFDLNLGFAVYGFFPGFFWWFTRRFHLEKHASFFFFFSLLFFFLVIHFLTVAYGHHVFLWNMFLWPLFTIAYFINTQLKASMNQWFHWPAVELIATCLLWHTLIVKFVLLTWIRARHLHLSWLTLWSQSIVIMYFYLFFDLWFLIMIGPRIRFLIQRSWIEKTV